MAPARHRQAADTPASGNDAPVRRAKVGRAWRANRVRLAASALALLACALLLPREREAFQAAVAATANLVASWQFAATLLPGREPLISRYTRFDFGHLPPDLGAYTRVLTVLWAALLAGFAAAHAVTALAGAHLSASAILAAEVVACGALFLGEHFVRNALFPHHRPATLRRTVRAVRLAHAARDAVAS
jgi:uncharacterized membrane protein